MPLTKAQRAKLRKQGFTPKDLDDFDAAMAPDEQGDDDEETPRRRSTDRRSGKLKTNGERKVTILEGSTADAFLAKLGFGDDDQGDDDGDEAATDDDEGGDDDDPEPEPDEKPKPVSRYFR
jgi:hypothetical protein